MDKDQALTTLLKDLKIALNNASICSHEHPFFIKSIEKLKIQLDKILKSIASLRIGIMPHSLVIDGNNWDKEKIHRDLAEFFHRRKIKVVELKDGITLDELVDFLTKVNMPAEDILKRGGLVKILNPASVRHVFVEELDYSPFLDAEGSEQTENIWESLLNKELQQADGSAMVNIESNFVNIAKRIKTKDLLTNERLRGNIIKLLDYLKNNDPDKFSECSRVLVKSIMKEKALTKDEDFEKIKLFFKDMSSGELSQAIWEDIVSDSDFDPTSFNVFSSLIAKDKEQDVADKFADQFEKNKENLKDNPQALDRIRDLFSSSNAGVSEVYRKALASFLSDEGYKEGVHLDKDLLRDNYRLTILNSLITENSWDNAQVIIEEISKELNGIDLKSNVDFIKNTLKALEVKLNQDLTFSDVLLGLRKNIGEIIEDAIVDGKVGFEFSDLIEEPSHSEDFYLKKIFEENIETVGILKLFIKFFPQKIEDFNKRLQIRSSDVNFIKHMVDNIKLIDSQFSLDALKTIFYFSNAFIKGEVLEAMDELSCRDYEFLLFVLKGSNVFLKKGALKCLAKDSVQARKAAGVLLALKNPLGIHSAILNAHIKMIEEVGLKEARRYLQHLVQRRFFWNKGVGQRAREVLSKLSHE